MIEIGLDYTHSGTDSGAVSSRRENAIPVIILGESRTTDSFFTS